jgi:predicted nucleotide-binding protein
MVSAEQVNQLDVVADEVEEITKGRLADLLPTLDAVISVRDDAKVQEQRNELRKIKTRITASDFAKAIQPRGQFMSRDTRALQGGFQVPPHIGVQAYLMSVRSTADQAKKVAEITTYTVRYLQKAMKMKGKTAAKTDGPIFIGHGHANDWRDLKDFLQDRLKLDWEEFNRVPTAGRSTKERVLEMLDRCPLAFLVMTAEDETKDGKFQARANVIHEAGLFQGRYGFERAIILLEDGCEEFSNMYRIGQIRFKSGNLTAVTEQIRAVLEREGLL